MTFSLYLWTTRKLQALHSRFLEFLGSKHMGKILHIFQRQHSTFSPAKTLTNSTLWSLCTTLIKLFMQFNLRNILPVSPPDIICGFSGEYHYWTMSVSQKKDNIVSLENKQLFSFLSLKHPCKFTWTLMRKRQLHSRGVRPCESQEAFSPWKKWDRRQFFYSIISRGSECWWCWQGHNCLLKNFRRE